MSTAKLFFYAHICYCFAYNEKLAVEVIRNFAAHFNGLFICLFLRSGLYALVTGGKNRKPVLFELLNLQHEPTIFHTFRFRGNPQDITLNCRDSLYFVFSYNRTNCFGRVNYQISFLVPNFRNLHLIR